MINKIISESTNCEFKVSLETSKPKSWLKTVCAYSNGLGGVIFFGIDNEKNIVGINSVQKTCDKISELIKARIEPIPNTRLNTIIENNKIVIVLNVLPGISTPYYYTVDHTREVYVRLGTQTILAPKHILDELVIKGQGKSYDMLTTNLCREDYSFTYFEATFLEKTFSRVKKEDYISFSLVNKFGYLNNAGILLADQNIYRHNRVFCTRWNGINKTSLNEASDDIEIVGSIIKQLEMVINFIKKHSSRKWKKTAKERIEKDDYDEISLREVIVNAIIHRDYSEIGSEITVDIYDDRIEIKSPGGMINGQLLSGDIISKIPSIRRNPVIADIFARMRFMDRRGSGFDKIKLGTNKLFDDNQNHVKFYSDYNSFLVIIENANYQKKHDDKLETKNDKLEAENDKLETENDKLEIKNDKLEIKNDKLETENDKLETKNDKLETENDKLKTENDKLETKNDKLEAENDKLESNQILSSAASLVLNYIIINPDITRKELSIIIKKSESTINRIIKELKDKNYIEKKNNRKNGEWIIK